MFEYWQQQMTAVGRDPSGLTMYIVVFDSNAPGGGAYQVWAYDAGDDGIDEGREVNPNAQPCPS